MTTNSISSIEDLPFLTADQPGVGGVIKQSDEDFQVEELPLYRPSGEGTHTYFVIEKRGLATLAAVKQLARVLGQKPGAIGYAGLKDAHGVTRQTFSVEHVNPEEIQSLSMDRMTVLRVDRHTNKLKLGHLAGNRFVIKIRRADPSPLPRARTILEVLEARGTPNYFGPQRFGVRGDNALVGRAVLRNELSEAIGRILGRPSPSEGDETRTARRLFDAGRLEDAAAAWPPGFSQQARLCRVLIHAEGDAAKAWRSVDHSLRKLYVAAVQSELFNRVLSQRITEVDRLETGDVAWKHANGACFRVESAAVEQPRCDAFEISPTGPLFGRRMMEALGVPGEREAAVLVETGLERSQIRVVDGSKLDGARRPLRVPLTNTAVDEGVDQDGPYLRLAFDLPPGAYATGVTREICKNLKAGSIESLEPST